MADPLRLPAGQAPAYGEPDEARPCLASPSPKGRAKIAQRLDEIGIGLYQAHVFVLSAGFIVAEGSELQMASGLSNALIEQFHITSHVGRSMLMTCTFIGFAVGTIASGPLGDIYGRRAPMAMGYVGVVCTAAVTTCAPSAGWIYLLRLILGFFGGVGIPTALITISEVSPTKLRGMSTAALGVAYCLGDLWAALGLWIILPDLSSGPWRLLLVWAAAPATTLLIFGMLSPVTRYDTPSFLAAKGRDKEVEGVMRLIAELNGRSDLAFAYSSPADFIADENKVAGADGFWRSVTSLFEWPMVLYTTLLGFMFFSKDFGYYGTGVFWPMAWVRMEIGELLPAQELLLTSILGIPGIGVAMAMMYRMNRRAALVVSGLICSGAFLLIWRLESGDNIGLLGVLFFKLLFPTWQMVTMLLPCELFPTEIRSCAYGIVATFGRIATIISPTIVERSHAGFLVACACMALGCAGCALLLPETKDCALADGKADSGLLGKASKYGSA